MKKTSMTTEQTSARTQTTDKKGEITMKKTGIREKIMAAVLATAAAFSICTMTMTATSVSVHAASLEENAKKIGIDTADAAFDTVADLFPGGKILMAPFKSLFHAGVDDKDPMEAITEKLDQIDNKLDQLDKKLDDLNESINKNTQWMADKIQNTADMSELRSDFKGLSPQVAKFVKDVKAIETNDKLSNSQKIMRLAALTDTTRYDNITTYVYNIAKSMGGSDPAYVDMFKALYMKEASTKMFAREAYQSALPTAEALIIQFVSAVSLMEECQTAVKAVAQFTQSDIDELNTVYDINLYNGFDLYRHSMDDNDAAEALTAAAVGAKTFQNKYDRPAFINKNATTEGRLIKLGKASGYEYVWSKDKSDHVNVEGKVKSNALTTAELTTIADYVRANYKNKSLYDFLVRDMGIPSNVSSDTYMIIGDKISLSKTRNSSIDKSLNGAYDVKGYDRVGTIKAIRLDDTNETVTDLKLYSYQSWDDEWMDWLFGTYYDIDTSTANLSYIKMLIVANA